MLIFIGLWDWFINIFDFKGSFNCFGLRLYLDEWVNKCLL